MTTTRASRLRSVLRACARATGLVACLAWAAPAAAAVWTVTGRWDEAAERRYADWVERRFDERFFYDGSPFGDIATDCADAAYGMRMAFAYEHRLPFVIRDPASPGRLLSQATSRFDHVPGGLPRVRAFMEWVMLHTGTASLARDTYPVRIDREQIRPGVVFLTWGTHAMQVVSLRPTGVIRYLESTAPRAIRPMRAHLGFPQQVPADPRAPDGGDGFRRFRWPEHHDRPDRLLPGWGDEQFERARALGRETLAFHDWVQSRLALEPEPPAQRARRTLFTLCELAYDRANAVDEAQWLRAELRRTGRACLTAAESDEHSTPVRDALLARAFEHVDRLPERADWPEAAGRYRRFVDLLTGHGGGDADAAAVRAEFLDWCDVGRLDGGPGRPMDLVELRALVRAGRLVADPQASAAARWGLEAPDGRLPAACTRR
ncbi:MAG: hypothetical protein RJA99_2446 [Pseudomonadota bacterium]|jgi:hypothetical protein